ncbi:MAG: class II aldolase/adducin family protein [Brevefilum sp.]|nr:class II aldolase/adducin family protein [Brevefilum sp.]
MLDSYKKITNGLVNWISRVGSASRGLNDSLVSKDVQTKFLESVKYAGSKAFVLDSLAEMSTRHSQSYFLVVGPNMQLQNIKAGDIILHSIDKDWTSADHTNSRHIDLHKQIYQHTGSRAVLLCHPRCAYIMQQKNIKPGFFSLTRIAGNC